MSETITGPEHLPFGRRMSPEQRRTAQRAVAAQLERRRSEQESRHRAAETLAAVAREHLRDVVGVDHWGELRELLARERLTLRQALQPPGGLDLTPALAHSARKIAVDGFLTARRVDTTRLAAVTADALVGLQRVLTPADLSTARGAYLPANLESWTALTPHHRADLAWGGHVAPDPGDPDDPHRWFVFQPPYFFLPSIGFEPVTSENFRAEWEWTFDAASGTVGVVATMDCDDADDIDYASVDAHVDVVVSFTPPIAGVVEVLIDAQNTSCSHDIRTSDEFGWSDSGTGQTNYLTCNVLHPNVVEPSYAEMSSFSVSGNEDRSYHQENLTIGGHYYADLFSHGAVPAGESVIVTAGTRSFDLSGTNDVEIHSRSTFSWFIRSVEVRIAP